MTCMQQAPTPMATGNPVTVEVCVHDAHDHATSLTLEERDRPCREALGGRCQRLTGETRPLRRLHEPPQIVEAHEPVVLGDALSDASVSWDIT